MRAIFRLFILVFFVSLTACGGGSSDGPMSSEGIWIVGLPETATIITVGHGYVAPGSMVNAVRERDIDTAVAIKSDDESN